MISSPASGRLWNPSQGLEVVLQVRGVARTIIAYPRLRLVKPVSFRDGNTKPLPRAENYRHLGFSHHGERKTLGPTQPFHPISINP